MRMDLITRERDRLLQRTARLFGLLFTGVSLICLSIPDAVDETAYAICVPLYLLIGACLVFLGRAHPVPWTLMAVGSAIAVVVVVTTAATPPGAAGISAIMQITSGSAGAVAPVLTVSARRRILLAICFAAVLVSTTALTLDLQLPARTAGLVTLSWIMASLVGLWITAAVPRAVERIALIGRAHRAERQASELEAQRRQGARLLHDTVLATLTLLAHSGVGVSATALREQAGDDARLLRQLRLGVSPAPSPATVAESEPPPVDEAILGTTLESVKQRFDRMGLEVKWHGTGQVLLPSDVLDAFLLSLAECLENVRRHSGVTTAHVTITEDEAMVRALVTDSGVGFSIEGIDENRFGFKESVVGRLHEVGGKARLFSSPGQGTTVVLEVPR